MDTKISRMARRMSRMTLRHLETLYDNMVHEQDGYEHTEASRAAERILFDEAAHVSGQKLTGYSHGEYPLDHVLYAAAQVSGKPWGPLA